MSDTLHAQRTGDAVHDRDERLARAAEERGDGVVELKLGLEEGQRLLPHRRVLVGRLLHDCHDVATGAERTPDAAHASESRALTALKEYQDTEHGVATNGHSNGHGSNGNGSNGSNGNGSNRHH